MSGSIPYKISAIIKDGKFVANQGRWDAMLRHYDSKVVIFTVEEYVDKRTLDQNALYWMYLGLIEIDTGNDANAMHAYFKREFIPTKFVTIFGTTVEAEKSTAKLNKKEFSEYMRKIEQLTEVPIPDTEGFRMES